MGTYCVPGTILFLKKKFIALLRSLNHKIHLFKVMYKSVIFFQYIYIIASITTLILELFHHSTHTHKKCISISSYSTFPFSQVSGNQSAFCLCWFGQALFLSAFHASPILNIKNYNSPFTSRNWGTERLSILI